MAPSPTEKKDALGREFAKVRFGKLYREQARAILAYALRRVENPEDASDVVAEAFLVAWRRLDEVPIGRERLWLYAVARRVTANVRRAEGRRTRLSERLAETLSAELAVHPGDVMPVCTRATSFSGVLVRARANAFKLTHEAPARAV